MKKNNENKSKKTVTREELKYMVIGFLIAFLIWGVMLGIDKLKTPIITIGFNAISVGPDVLGWQPARIRASVDRF